MNTDGKITDIQRFIDESEQYIEDNGFVIRTKNYALMKKELYKKFMKSQAEIESSDNKYENRIEFSIEYRDLINKDEAIRIILEKIMEHEDKNTHD